jgi:hypothetical protein
VEPEPKEYLWRKVYLGTRAKEDFWRKVYLGTRAKGRVLEKSLPRNQSQRKTSGEKFT